MKNLIPTACLLIGIAAGIMPGEWKGEADTLRAYASIQAPGIDPTCADATSKVAVYRSRAPMAVKRRP
jgi:hypothetical protein